jgi:5-methylcytosine-specific restriction endonuclease McrA
MVTNREHRRAWERDYVKRPHVRAVADERRRQHNATGKNVERAQARTAWQRAGDVTWQQLREIYLRDGGACVYCGAPVRGVMDPINGRGFDHVIPRVKGGRHTASNLVVCCHACNAKKSIYLID